MYGEEGIQTFSQSLPVDRRWIGRASPAPVAFLGLFSGDNIGKQVVAVSE